MNDDIVQDIINWINEETKNIKQEIENRTHKVDKLENIANQLKSFNLNNGYKEKYEEVNDLYEKEKDRLVKLHNHYKKLEENCDQLKTEIDGWRRWFQSNKDIFDRLFSAPPSMNQEIDDISESDKKSKKKK